MNCTGAVALVTGAAKRVGRAIALELVDMGCAVAVHYNRSVIDALELTEHITSGGGTAVAVRGDLLDPATPTAIVGEVRDRLGRLNVLINNASVFESDPPGPFQAAHWLRTYQINTFAPAALIAAAEDALTEGACGKVVNLCDISADRPWPGYLAYCSSKAALVNLTKAAAQALAPTVQVNGISPGIAVFPDEFDEVVRDKLIASVPLRRAGGVEDVACAVRFLVEQGDYITGQIINVDGGRSVV